MQLVRIPATQHSKQILYFSSLGKRQFKHKVLSILYQWNNRKHSQTSACSFFTKSISRFHQKNTHTQITESNKRPFFLVTSNHWFPLQVTHLQLHLKTLSFLQRWPATWRTSTNRERKTVDKNWNEWYWKVVKWFKILVNFVSCPFAGFVLNCSFGMSNLSRFMRYWHSRAYYRFGKIIFPSIPL